LGQMTQRAAYLIVLSGLSVTAGLGQEIRIKVLDGRNGRPITNECVNVWVGFSQVASIVIPTNKDGAAILRISKDKAEISTGQPVKGCNSSGAVRPVFSYAETISITSDYYVPCQVHLPDSPGVTFSTAKVLESG